MTDCWYCGKKAHRESKYWTNNVDLDRAKPENQQRLHYVGDSRHARKDPMFVMKDKANSMEASTSKQKEVWYINSGASNHMTNHG